MRGKDGEEVTSCALVFAMSAMRISSFFLAVRLRLFSSAMSPIASLRRPQFLSHNRPPPPYYTTPLLVFPCPPPLSSASSVKPTASSNARRGRRFSFAPSPFLPSGVSGAELVGDMDEIDIGPVSSVQRKTQESRAANPAPQDRKAEAMPPCSNDRAPPQPPSPHAPHPRPSGSESRSHSALRQ